MEETHVLLDASSNAGEGEANPSAIAQGLVKRMLAEIRSYGVGIVIADQSPRKVTTDVVALTDIKIVFRGDMEDGSYGGYNPDTNSIEINENMLYDNVEAADTIAHEMWHAYQEQAANDLTLAPKNL